MTPALGLSSTILAAAGGAPLGARLPLWTVVPFALLLTTIALASVVAPRIWARLGAQAAVSAALGLPLAFYLVATGGAEGRAALRDAASDYLSFVVLLGALFVISGGIHLRGSLAGTPLANTCLLGLGAVLANLVGTTGAAMLLVRPLLAANRERRQKAHLLVFFIFVVANCGGLLTPLGDPPLYLGFLQGVPFLWTLRLVGPWLFVNGALLAVFHLLDRRFLARDRRQVPEEPLLEELLEHEPLRLEGAHNLLSLAAVVGVTLAQGVAWGTAPAPWRFGIAELLLAGIAAAAYGTTAAATRRRNHFHFRPMVEVAVLFAGIFATLTAPLAILNARGGELGLTHPAGYFWASGMLSAVLDSAPSYLAFAVAAAGQAGVAIGAPSYLAEFLARGPEAARIVAAISCGTVFFGAVTYLGNGPNLMVKAIAEHRGVRMPSFFGFVGWAAIVLLPILAAASWLFFG
ncbi:MAG: sodium:proton antiporter [Thermoanaerobaculia bacterium]